MGRRGALALSAALAAGAVVAAGAAQSAPVLFPLLPQGVTYPVTLPAVPIPADPGFAGLTTYTGAPATPRPMAFTSPPRHPFMAQNERSNIHNDAYQTDANRGTGALGRNLQVTTTTAAGICGSVTFDGRGRIVSVCVGPVGTTLQVIEPKTLGLMASYPLPTKVRTGGSKASFGGGGYFYLDNQNRAVIPTSDGRIVIVAVGQGDTPSLTLEKVYDLRDTVGSQTLESALPDWSGLLWFVTTGGLVGTIDSSGTVRTVLLRNPETHAGEEVGNSFAIDETGGVFIVSEYAQYRLDAGKDSAPRITWRTTYDRGQRVKPGMVNHGSGTTPTLMGSGSGKDGGYLAILDNGDPYMRVVIFPRGKSIKSNAKPICSVRVLTQQPSRTSDENSIIAVGNSLFVENNYGNDRAVGPQGASLRLAPTTEPGLERIDVDLKAKTCKRVWTSTEQRVPSTVSKVAAGSGLLFTYTHPAIGEATKAGPGVPDQLALDPWYLTAVDAHTGKQRWSQLIGSSALLNNFYAPITIGPDNTVYVGVLGGLVAVRDGS